jgi:HSP20 family protein
MAIVKWRPMRDIFAMQDEMNRMFDSFWGDRTSDDDGMLMPPVDVTEKNDKFTVSVELPGMKKEDIKLSLQNSVLTITGTKNRESEPKDDRFHRIERSFGTFCRTINLASTVDASGIDADFKDGILTVNLPKVEEAKPREISIKG